MSDKLRDKRIFIAGGTSGLGLAVAALAAKRGANLILASRSAPERRAELTQILGQEITTQALDVTSAAATSAALKGVGEIDHLVVATRSAITPAPFAQADLDQAKQAFETKFWGTCRLIQQLAPRIRPAGSITLTTGIAGEKIYPNQFAMAAMNGATETLCRTLAVELAPIRVNAVSPGFIAPKPPEVETYASQFPSGRLADIEEAALTFIQLMENTYVTGATLVVDGGARLI
ncbi:SDR family oxidoreductase [Pseudodesulfovibrio sp.]|uniref:SDR family oxidoreductase n=1 Tax=unclassified Pseudodesulfovibrio TaxID=2661612 RepID=UPI003AFF8DD0